MNMFPWQAGEFLAPMQEAVSTIDRYAYQIGEAGFLSPVGEAIELIDMQPIYWVPNLPPHVRGVTSVHGFLIPAVDLGVLFGKTSGAASKWLLVFGQEQSSVALLIHSLPVKKTFNCADQVGLADCPDALAPHVLGVYPWSKDPDAPPRTDINAPGVWLDFDHKSYFSNGAFT